jgi:hypothetical protein
MEAAVAAEGARASSRLVIGRAWYWLGAFLLSGVLWLLIIWAVSSVASAGVVTVRQMIGDARYWPPACEQSVCVLTGLGGIVQVWERHVDKHKGLGRTFVVEGICASACEIAARRAGARIAPGATLIVHEPSPARLS